MILFINGAIALGYWVAGMFFLRFWRQSRDRLFAIFAISFWILGIQRALISVPSWVEHPTWLYGIRLGAFLLILGAVIDKNRVRT